MATNDNSMIVGVFNDYGTAERAVRALADSGVPEDSIQIRSELKTQAVGGTEESEGGGFSGWIRRVFGSGMPEKHTEQYESVIRRGGALVCVTGAGVNDDRVVDILNSFGAIDVEEEAAGSISETVRTNPPAPQRDQAERIPVIEEEVKVGKRAVQRGGARMYSRTLEEPVEQDLTLREEHIEVQRRPVDRPVTAADEAKLGSEPIEMVEIVEEPVISKQRRVKEEVVINKRATERKETVRDTARHTEVKVEPIGETASSSDYSADFRRDYEARYANSGVTYQVMEPAYLYGYRMASDPRFKGQSWSRAESQLKTDYMREHPNSVWDKISGAVRYGWERVTGQR